jgi:hypothetical protein
VKNQGRVLRESGHGDSSGRDGRDVTNPSQKGDQEMAERPILTSMTSSDSDNHRQPGRPPAAIGPSRKGHPSPIARAIKDGDSGRPSSTIKIGGVPDARFRDGPIIGDQAEEIREWDGSRILQIGIPCGDERAEQIAR